MDDRRQMINAAGVAAIPAVMSSVPPPPPAPPTGVPDRYRCWTCKEPIVRGDRCVCGRGWFVERAP